MDRRRLGQVASGAAFLAVCAVAVLVVLSQAGSSSGGDTDLEDVGLVGDQLRGIAQHGTVLGDRGAPVQVVEYGDLQCPVCMAFAEQAAPGLIDRVVRDGTASYELLQWPVIGQAPHTQSVDAAKAALAASDQDRYWNYVELFYRNQGAEGSGYVTGAFLTAIAKGAEVPDLRRWNRDRRSSRYDDVLARTDAEAADLGFTGTPSFVVEGPGGRRTLTVATPDDIEDAIREVE